MRIPRVILGWACLGLASLPLFGQTRVNFDMRIQDIVRRSTFRFGPFYAHPKMKFSMFSWVSSIYGYQQNAEPVPDVVIVPSPELDLHLVLGHSLILTFSENPEYHYYVSESQYRGFTNSYSAKGELLFFGLLIFSGEYAKDRGRQLGTQELDRIIETVGESTRASVLYETGRGTTLALTGSMTKRGYEDFLRQGAGQDTLALNLDREEQSGSFEISYPWLSASRWVLDITYTQYRFASSVADWRDTNSFRVLTGIRLPLAGQSRGEAMVGYERFTPEAQGLSGFSGLVASVNVEIRLSNLGILGLRFSRDPNFSMRNDYLYYINSTYGGTVTTRAVGPLVLRAGGNYSLLDYQESAPGLVPAAGGLQRDTLLDYFGGVILRFSPTFGLGFSYHQWQRRSGLFGDHDGYYYSVDLVTAF